MRMHIYLLFLAFFIIAGCESNSMPEAPGEEIKSYSDKRAFEESGVNVVIFNHAQHTDETLDEVENIYQGIIEKIVSKTPSIKKKKSLYINLRQNIDEEYNDSYAEWGGIVLYDYSPLNEHYYYAAYALLIPQDGLPNMFTLDGLSFYFGQKYSPEIYDNSYNSLVRYFHENNVLFPLKWLMLRENYELTINTDDNKTPESQYLEWKIGWTQAASFSEYLISYYGIEKYQQIFGVQHLERHIQNVYGKSILELENEWLDWLESLNLQPLTEYTKSELNEFLSSYTTP